ncbi:hypothetical protein [Nitrobacter sp. Nb-311A]|uniref:hypothetical protein n=1 Tax=Nitrobacter sp. Nb-311A TaxID=314253 RepID=UPI003528FF6A
MVQHRLYYTRANNSKLTEPGVLNRIKALAIPPAWSEVWVCSFTDGHIKAAGRDAKAASNPLSSTVSRSA